MHGTVYSGCAVREKDGPHHRLPLMENRESDESNHMELSRYARAAEGWAAKESEEFTAEWTMLLETRPTVRRVQADLHGDRFGSA